MKHFYHHIIILLCIMAVSVLHGQTVSSWQTAASQNKLFEQQPGYAFTTGNGNSPNKITIDENTRYQSVEGFGWTMTQGSAKLIRSLGETQRKELLNELFNVNSGIGSTVIRIGIGATDLSERSYTYNDVNNDPELTNFSLAGPDLDDLIPVLKEALAINPDIKILATPWTAPTWMKSNANSSNKYIGGELNPVYNALYAKYFIRYFEAMRAQGIEIWAVTPQNEPLHDGNEPSMHMSAEQQYDFVHNHLGPAIQESNFSHVKIIAYDHNCDHPEYAEYVCKSPYVHGSAFHLYDAASDIEALSRVHSNTDKPVYFTEQYTGPDNFSGDLGWHMKYVMLGAVNNYARIALEWNLAVDSNYEPHTPGGCTSCLGGLTIDGTTVSKNVSYYLIAQMSKVTRAGAYRLASFSTNDKLLHTVFANPDGTMAIVVFNDSNKEIKFDIVWNGKYFNYTLGAKTVSSLLWDAGSVTIPVTGVNVTPDIVNDLPQRNTIQLTATIYPENATIKTVKWASGNVTVASVNENGLVKGINPGEAVITVTTDNGNKKAACTVRVIKNDDDTGDYPHLYNIISVYSNKGLDIKNKDMNPGAGVQQWEVTNGGGDNQRWLLEHTGGDNYYIRSKFSGLYLTVAGNEDGADITQEQFTGTSSQEWEISATETGIYKMINAQSNKAMDVEGPSVNNGAVVHTWSYTGADNQKWQLTPVEYHTTGTSVDNTCIFSLYPNPATGNLYIVFDAERERTITLLSLSGNQIYSQKTFSNRNEINISSLSEGIYIIRIEDGNGIYYHKVIKKIQ